MPQSFASVHIHIVFSTKNRAPLLTEAIRPKVFDYIGALCKSHKCALLAAGGIDDHVHLLVSLSREISIADLVREIKAASSRWLHDSGNPAFAWQSGYAAFGVSYSAIGDVREYLANQAEHHRKMSYQDELRAILRKHGLEFDERYVWD